ncbi:uncharacterized protein LOC132340481 [Haemorhous mexicanus]|uniref:uncharacterized protein LOC132340481 n=1 Tax=Haemorhous mexicanus TaxID=30427 RepID=UPI0028BEBC66|nr:uncharacterized protein LOC132340481 [Haemorhous mexicanus]
MDHPEACDDGGQQVAGVGGCACTQELQHLLRDIKPALKGTKDTYPNVPEDLVAKVAMAEQLWEANTRLAKDHLLGTLPDSITFYFYCGPAGPNACEVAEQCQRAIKDIPRLLRPPERPQSVPKVSPVSMELQELSLARLQPQVTVVAILGQLLDTMPWLDKEMLPVSRRCLYWDLEEFTKELQTTLYHIGGTQWHRTVTSDDDGPPATLSQALATYESTPGTTRDHVTMVASKWQGSVALLVNSWAKLARAATKFLNTCRDLATEADDKVATATARARELQVKAARYGTAQENMVELGQVLGREEGARVVARPEARVRREAWVATSEATRATMVRQRVEAALGLLEGLVAACDEATAFPRELQRLLRDIEATLEGTNEASPDVPEDLVAKVAEAERLWEANTHLAQDHLLQAVPDFTEFLFNSCPTGPRASEVAEQCQRAIEDIPRLLRPLERPQSVSKVTPVSKEPQELSSARLQPQVSVVAILGKLLATLPSQDKMKVVSAVDLYRDLEEFTKDLWATLYHIDGTWWCRDVTVDDDDPVTSLSQALAAYESTPWTPQNRVTMAASKWHTSVSVLMNSWAKLARKATKLRNACKRAVSEAADMVAATTARARHLQDMLARYWTAQENMVKLGQALGGEEGTKKLDAHEARVREQAMEATSEATRATMVRQQVEVALGLLEHLVAVCDEAAAFPRELQRLLRDIEAALKGTNEASPDVPEALVAKVAVAERL